MEGDEEPHRSLEGGGTMVWVVRIRYQERERDKGEEKR